MKILTYTTLLLIFMFMVLPCSSQVQEMKHNSLYKSVNKAHNNEQIVLEKKIPASSVIIRDTVSAAALDSVLRNMVGVIDITQGGRSILNHKVSLSVDARSSDASNALFGCIESLDRAPETGKAMLDPRIPAIPTAKVNSNKAVATSPAITSTANPASATPAVTAPTPASTSTSKPATTSSQGNKNVNNSDWKEFKSTELSLAENSEKASFRKYSIVVGYFKSFNNADYVRRTFNALGESTLVVKKEKLGTYYALMGSFDTEAEANKKLDELNRKYVNGMSKSRRISKYGVALDDMWIMTIDQ